MLLDGPLLHHQPHLSMPIAFSLTIFTHLSTCAALVGAVRSRLPGKLQPIQLAAEEMLLHFRQICAPCVWLLLLCQGVRRRESTLSQKVEILAKHLTVFLLFLQSVLAPKDLPRHFF